LISEQPDSAESPTQHDVVRDSTTQRFQPEDSACLPALTDELLRVQVELAIARRHLAIDEMRAKITAEEADQRLLQRQIDERLGVLRGDVDRMTTEIARLEARIERLSFSRRALTDSELDDEDQAARAEEAAFWAEWRQQRDERRASSGPVFNHRPQANAGDALKLAYRTLARLIHPDLARDQADRNRREAVMRLANAANDAGDIEQIRRLISIWSRPEDGDSVRDIGALRARLADRDLELAALKRQLTALEATQLARSLRRPKAELTRFIKREEERLRREIATLRLRRRRLALSLEERRREMSNVSD
jgi:hypothetical protein